MNRQKATEIVEGLKKQPKKKEMTFKSADQLKFKEVIPGASMAVLWGNDETGPHASITKFEPGFDAGMHMHTNDGRIVVIKGAYLYKDEKGEKRVGPGDFLFVPGGTKHWAGGDAKEGALFFHEMDGKFDLKPLM